MASDTAVMGRKPKPKAAAGREQYRKPYKQARIRMTLAEVVERIVPHLAQDFTQCVNDAVRMRLAAEGHWPPPAS